MDMYQKREQRKKDKEEGKNKSCTSVSINWFPGHMAKTIREIKNDIKLIDIVLVVLDSRIPYTSLNKDIYEIIKQKTCIMLFNKSDLANPISLKEAEKKYIKEGCYVATTNATTGEGIQKVISLIRELGSKIKYENKTSKAYKDLKPVYRVLVVGIPNVGKSSVINQISGRKTAEVGNKPGITKKKQWIKVGQDIELMDTAGVFSPKFSKEGAGEKLAITGNIKDEIIDVELLALSLINTLISNDWYYAMLKDRYKLDTTVELLRDCEILEQIGRKRGALLKGDVVDINKTARILLEDYRSNKLGKISLE